MVVLCCIHIPQEMGNQGIRIRVSEPSKSKSDSNSTSDSNRKCCLREDFATIVTAINRGGSFGPNFSVNSIQQPHSASTNQLPQVEMLKSQGFEAFNYKDRQMVGIFDSAVE